MTLRNPLWPWPPRPLAGQGRSTPRPSPSLRQHRLNVGGAGILNLLPIVYAVRPRLRTRLTLGGRTFPRKPWIYGVPEFHRDDRYSCLHPHFRTLHGRFPFRFDAYRTLPYPSYYYESRASVYCLSPIIIGAESLDESAITHCLNDGCL